MEHGVLLVEKDMDGYRPLGAFGQPVHRSYVQLRAGVAQRLSSQCANLFARPQYDERSRKIRWISPIAGEPRNWRDLEPHEQAERAIDLHIIRGEFESYLAELREARGEGGGEAFASVLEQSLKTPNDGHLHFVGDQPVITFWGFTELNGDAFEALAAAPPSDPVPMTAAATLTASGFEEERRWRFPTWLAWLLPLLLLLLVFLLWWFLWNETDDRRIPALDPAPSGEILAPPGDDYRVLPDRLRSDGRPVIVDRSGRVVDRESLRIDGQGRVLDPDGKVIDGVTPDQLGLVPGEDVPAVEGSGPETSVEPGAETPAPGPLAEDAAEPPARSDDLAEPEPEPEQVMPAIGEDEDAGASPSDEGDPPEAPGMTDPPPLPADPTDAVEPPVAAPGDPLTLPPAAPDPGGDSGPGSESGTGGSTTGTAPAGFMRGKWISRSALSDEQGNRLDQIYQFDEYGKGLSVIRRADGAECTAPAEARMEDGRLSITEQANPTCPDGQQFKSSETACEVDASGRTRCKGNGYDVQIERAGQ